MNKAVAPTGSGQFPRNERIAALLAKGGAWPIDEGRDQTRRALIELLDEMPDAEFAHVEGSRVLLQAFSKGTSISVTPYTLVCKGPQEATEYFEFGFQFITLDAALEAYPLDRLKEIIRWAFTSAFARLEGFNEWQAIQIAESAKRNSSGRVV